MVTEAFFTIILNGKTFKEKNKKNQRKFIIKRILSN
jgi:hypothetical protein